MNEEQLKAYRLEISTFGNIPISSRNCAIGCIYCKVHIDPILKRFPSIPDISMEDLYYGFQYVDSTSKYLRLGAGVLVAPHTDPYLHPLIYDFVEHTAKYFPAKKVTTVTTGSYIQEHKLDFLSAIPNFGIDLSLVTMQDSREKIVPRATRERILHLLKHAPLNKVTLMFTGDLDVLKRDLELVYSFDLQHRAQEILVRRIEYTKYSNVNLNSIAFKSIQHYEACVQYLKENHPNIIYTVPVLKEVFSGGNNEYFIQADERIRLVKQNIMEHENRTIHVLCPESCFEYFTHQFPDFPNVRVHMIKNHLYGGSVTVAGLLSNDDIMFQFAPVSPDDLVILPREMYNSEMQDIIGKNLSDLKSMLNSEIWLM